MRTAKKVAEFHTNEEEDWRFYGTFVLLGKIRAVYISAMLNWIQWIDTRDGKVFGRIETATALCLIKTQWITNHLVSFESACYLYWMFELLRKWQFSVAKSLCVARTC